jgi:hypothetical protein
MAYSLYYEKGYKDKLNQLSEVSNPKEVIIKAKDFFKDYFKDPNIEVYQTINKNKKYMILNHHFFK